MKIHPSLLPYDQLDEAARARSKDVGTKFLRVVYALGFTIAARGARFSLHGSGSINHGGETEDISRSATGGVILPIKDEDIVQLLGQSRLDRTPLSDDVSKLIDLLAADRHHTWAWNRMKLGWSLSHGAHQDSRLVPFNELEEGQKAEYKSSMEVLLRFLLLCGWDIHQSQSRRRSSSTQGGVDLNVSEYVGLDPSAHGLNTHASYGGQGGDRWQGLSSDDNSFCGIIPEEDEDDIKKTFSMFDPGRSGIVPKANILFALQALGWAVDVTEAANIAIQMNPNPKSSGVTYQQFLRWIRRREAQRDEPPNMAHIIEEAFVQVE